MAGFLSNLPHSFGDESCQDALVVRLPEATNLHPRSKQTEKSAKMIHHAVQLTSWQPSQNSAGLKSIIPSFEDLKLLLQPLLPTSGQLPQKALNTDQHNPATLPANLCSHPNG